MILHVNFDSYSYQYLQLNSLGRGGGMGIVIQFVLNFWPKIIIDSNICAIVYSNTIIF